MPKELKVAFLSKRFRTFNKVSHHKPEGSPPPQFLADKVPTPSWWKGGEVLAVFDKIMLEKVSCLVPRLVFPVVESEKQLTG